MTEPNELCRMCSTVDLYSLFSGPRNFPGDGFGNRRQVALGTLEEVKVNRRCPLCRLVNHAIYDSMPMYPWVFYGNEPELSKVQCNLSPVRADYHEEMRYHSEKTREMVATKVVVRLLGTEYCTQEESGSIPKHRIGAGIRLLSPDSIDPQSHIIYPMKEGSGTLIRKNDIFEHNVPALQEIEVQGLLVSLAERPHRFNRCVQNLAMLCVDVSTNCVIITSEVAKFHLDIVADISIAKQSTLNEATNDIPGNFDSRLETKATRGCDIEYETPYNRFLARDSLNNIYKHYYPRWYGHTPFFNIALPYTLRGWTLTWLLRDGIELVKIVELELVTGAEELEHVHHVLCLGVDRSPGIPNHGRRIGMFCIPKERLMKAKPEERPLTFLSTGFLNSLSRTLSTV